MTIAVRNRIILSGTGLIAVCAGVFFLSLALLFRTTPVEPLTLAGQESIAPLALALLCELIFSVAAVLVLYFSFRKTASPEIFFFILFVMSMSFDAVKMLHILFDVTAIPPYFDTILTRVIVFGKSFGTLCLFACGLFAVGVSYERLEIVLVTALLLAFALSASLPVDMTSIEPNFVMTTGYERELSIITYVLYAFAVGNFLLAAFQTANKSYILIGLGMAMVMVGREILYYRYDGLSVIVAFVLLVAGSTLFGEQTHEVHLWA